MNEVHYLCKIGGVCFYSALVKQQRRLEHVLAPYAPMQEQSLHKPRNRREEEINRMLADEPKNSHPSVDAHVSCDFPVKQPSFTSKAQNPGASCEHVFVDVISKHTSLIESAGIQSHADCTAPGFFFFFF